MSNCPKCGAKVKEDMSFCPKCGAPLKAEKPPAEAAAPASSTRRGEKAEEKAEEKGEKHEKAEKAEKYEKREVSFIAPFIGGLILIFLGVMAYLQVTRIIGREVAGAIFLIVVGIIIIIAAFYAMTVAAKRHPRA
ncbi:MAG: zinc ribbon domain-containing protein [Candidatus Bathyarchaeia archaeon]